MIGSHQWLPRVWRVGLSLTRMWHKTKQTKPDCPGTCNNSQVEKSRICFFHLGLGNDMLTMTTWHSHSSILRGLPRLMVGLEALGFSMKTARGRDNRRYFYELHWLHYETRYTKELSRHMITYNEPEIQRISSRSKNRNWEIYVLIEHSSLEWHLLPSSISYNSE